MVPVRGRGRIVAAAFVAGLCGVLVGAQGALGKAAVPELDWAACGEAGAECATAEVPLDYGKPNGKAIDLEMVRLKATDPERRIGSLFINPGGPGGPAKWWVETFGARVFKTLNDRFDIVGFDPRGVGKSAGAVDCDIEDQEVLGLFAQPFTTPENLDERQLVADDKRYLRRCMRRNDREILPYISTANVARDMDLLREAVGDSKLNYFGYSYGGYLGATYASMFPHRYRAMVLDAPLDAKNYANRPIENLREQSAASERTRGRFLAACAADQVACSGFGGADPATALDELIERADRQPLPSAQGRPVDGDDIRIIASGNIGSKRDWGLLGQLLAEAEAGDGTGLRAVADGLYARLPDGSSLLDANVAIRALDLRWPRDVDAYLDSGDHAWGLFDYAYWSTGYTNLVFGLYPVRPRGVFYGPFKVPDSAATPLVVSNTYDPTTPYRGARRLVRQQGNSRLLTMRGDGHTAYGSNTPCINDAVDAYLENGVLPAKGTTCKQEVAFTAPTATQTARAERGTSPRPLTPLLPSP